jgi:starch-binding outer membrane protein, SusD/RagB family
MKTLKYIGIFLTLGLLLNSCQDEFLNLEPKTNKMEGNSYKTEDDAFLALVSVYDAISHQEVLNFQPYRSDIYSDDTYTGGEGMESRWLVFEQSILDSESATCAEVWRRCYRGIYRANQFLEKEGGIDWTDMNKRDRMVAEAKFLKAYFYWDLVRHFGWVPLVKELISSETARSLPQSEPVEIYQHIAENLLQAIPNLPEMVNASEYGRATKGAAKVLMARIYLYYEGYGKGVLGITSDWSDGNTVITEAMVKQAMDDIINGEGGYTLLDNYADIHAWENENNAESIFEIQYSEKSGYNGWASGNTTEEVNGNTCIYITGIREPKGDSTISPGWSFGTITWSLEQEFEDGDPRYELTVYNADEKLTSYKKARHNTGYFNNKWMPLAKYVFPNSAHNSPKNFIDMRFAEVLLIAAELYFDEDNARATGYLNQVRTRSLGLEAALVSITLEDIYHERRIELACEGHRYWDLLRRGLDYAADKINASNIPDPNHENQQEILDLYFDKGHMGMLPIPNDEILNANTGVLEQKIDFYR